MTSSPAEPLGSGLHACFSDFQGAYCTRKFTELLLSTSLLLLAVAVTAAYGWKYRLERKLWLMAVLALMAGCLLANILFCFFNEQYWLYAIENYTYNLYFLLIVAYVARAYVLKGRTARPGEEKSNGRGREKMIFYGVFVAVVVLYSVIFVASVVREVDSERDDDSGKVRYCEEVEYLTFDVLCTVMSIVVLVILHKNQKEEQEKMAHFSSIGRSRPRGSLLSDENEKMASEEEQRQRGKFHDPLGTVWVWIVTNVLCQIFGLVQSGLLLSATPSQCLLIKSNPNASNYLELAFTLLTMYMGFAVTLWYVILVSFVRGKTGIDRTVNFSQEVKVEGNIELFNPSREETIFTL